jgi:L-fuculose-phosphate aldolase
MGENLKPFLPKARIMILKHHGALTWGESVDEALNGMERLEHACEVFFKASLMGGLQKLPDGEKDWLLEKRKELGERIL